MIVYDSKNRLFNLQTKNTSYVLRVMPSGHLEHVHYGPLVCGDEFSDVNPIIKRAWSANPLNDGSFFSLDTARLEYPSYGHSDFREPAIEVEKNGSTVLDLLYSSHEILDHKEDLQALPSADGKNVKTLVLVLRDEVMALQVKLIYAVYAESDIIVRSSEVTNYAKENITIKRIYSASLDFDHSNFDMVQLSGAWARERHVLEKELSHGIVSVESKRGNSSHQQNPFVALKSKTASEHMGEVYGFSLIYSGNFKCGIEVNEYNQTRLGFGINPFGFNWLLESMASFQTPELVMTFSGAGLNKMSHNFHHFIHHKVIRKPFRQLERPILINNWEATYFDFDEDKLLALADKANQVGIELFVLDDGWFGDRNTPDRSLGDWFVNLKKIPSGLKGLSEKINDRNLKFGLWVEPEMISPNSDLYRQHPQWCLHERGRSRSETRNQLMLDLSRVDVQDYLIDRLTDLFHQGNIEYVKWDMNRNMTEAGSAVHKRSGEIYHRYMLGFYRVLKHVTENCSHILFESCAGGGGRFDMGMLYYMPQTWTSDDTDAYERIKIQYGTSFVYPLITMGAHVSDVPNHQVDRSTELAARYQTAMFGNLGYELDLTALTDDELTLIGDQVEDYKTLRHTLQLGEFSRLQSPFDSNYAAWQVKTDKEVIVYYSRGLAIPNDCIRRLRLMDLDHNSKYKLKDKIYTGDYLMAIGIVILPEKGDFRTEVFRCIKVGEV